MEFIDLASQQGRIRAQLNARIDRVLSHHQYINGPEVRELEETLSRYAGRRYGVGCASGTDALLMALLALGVGPGDAVFTTPFTFMATAEVASLLGATPVFVDIDPVTYNIDPVKLEAAVCAFKEQGPPALSRKPSPGVAALQAAFPDRKIVDRRIADRRRPRPRALITVDLFGLPADYDSLNALCERHGLFLIEDAAQSFGGRYQGQPACSFGAISCTSFFPAKPLGCYGDGGMCFTDDPDLDTALRSIRVHGQGSDKYENIRIGINGRLDTLQAAILQAKFEIFPEELALRQQVASRYTALLQERFTTPAVPAGYFSAWAQYSVLGRDAADRQACLARLKQAGIPAAIYYPKPLHLQGAFARLGYREGDFPVSEDCAGRIFSLPMHPYLAEADQERIASVLLAGQAG